jgi:rubrerythrin
MSILISKKHGVNPTITMCRLCGEETGEIMLLGECNEYKCSACGSTTFGRMADNKKKCPQCGSSRIDMIASDVKAPMQLKSGGICEKCKAIDIEHAALVRQGGVYWRCQTCGSAGVIRPGTKFALMVRHTTQIVAPNPVGVDFTSEECPVCQNRAKEKLDDSGARSKGRRTN